MRHQLWFLLAAGALALVVAAIGVGLARDSNTLLAPARMILLVLGIALYLLPVELAVYRDCKATAWITALNVLLGWTIFGWIVAIGWAASGKARTVPPSIPAPPGAVVTGH